MGVAISFFKNKDEVPIPKLTPLTPAQCEMIRTTWTKPGSSPKDTGEVILMRFFDEYPKNQYYFSAFRNAPLLSLKGTPGFRTHAARIIMVFGNAIDALNGTENDTEEVKAIFEEMSKTHVKRNIARKSFLELRDVMMNVLNEVCELNEDQSDAWMLLLNNAFHFIFTSIANELAKEELKAAG